MEYSPDNSGIILISYVWEEIHFIIYIFTQTALGNKNVNIGTVFHQFFYILFHILYIRFSIKP